MRTLNDSSVRRVVPLETGSYKRHLVTSWGRGGDPCSN